MPVIDDDVIPARKPAAHAFIGFEDEGFESAFGKMEGGGESGDSPADDDDVVVFVHYVDYSYTSGNVKGMQNMELIKIKLSFSNAYLIKGKKSVLVDAGSPNEADKILGAVQKAGINARDISLILHTHGHFDHAGSTAELKRRLKVPVAVHANDAFMLREGRNGEIKPRNLEARLIMLLVPNSFEATEPDILVEEEMDLNDFGVEARIIFTPGHTKGSISVLCNNEAIVGDIMMGGWAGGAILGSRPNYHYFIDNIEQLHASIKKILGIKPQRLYVGHGGHLKFEDVFERFSAINIIGN